MERAFPPAWPHRDIQEVFPDVFFVTGLMKMKPPFQFSRNMIILRQDGELILVNTVRLTEQGLAQLDALGKVAHVIKIGFFHDRDDAFYVHRYGARFWALPGHEHAPGLRPDVEMTVDTALPIRDARLFVFETAQKPEAIIHLDRQDGILIACDSLQNWAEPHPEFNFFSRWMMRFLGFIKPANVGPFWLKYTQVQQQDFDRLHALSWRHVLGAHGDPVEDTAHDQYGATFRRILRRARK
jgi:hypothetical protein